MCVRYHIYDTVLYTIYHQQYRVLYYFTYTVLYRYGTVTRVQYRVPGTVCTVVVWRSGSKEGYSGGLGESPPSRRRPVFRAISNNTTSCVYCKHKHTSYMYDVRYVCIMYHNIHIYDTSYVMTDPTLPLAIPARILDMADGREEGSK